MKDKNLLDDIKIKSLTELTEIAANLVKKLEKQKDLEKSIEEYQKLLTINNLIQKKFQNTSREISDETREKIKKILNDGKKLYKVARDTNSFLKKFLNKQKKTSLISPMKYGLFREVNKLGQSY